MGIWSDMIGTLKTSFKIGKSKAVLDASGLTASRTLTIQDAAGTVALLADLNSYDKLAYADGSVPGGNTAANTAAETAFASAYTVAANTLTVGSVIRLRLWGTYSTALAAPTLQLRIRWGGVAGTLLLDSGAQTMVGSLTNDGWSAEVDLIVTAIGAAGTFEVQGYSRFATAATTELSVSLKNTAAVTVDTTASKALAATVTWGTADASNTITLRSMIAELMKP